MQLLYEIIKGVIAIVVLVGGGLLAYFGPDTRDYVFPVLGFVVGYYFAKRELPLVSAILNK